MPLRLKYKMIAVFFLLVFSLNTAAGFACSIGIDMGYNSGHHSEKTNVKKHDHVARHHHSHKEQHTRKATDGSGMQDKDDCCSHDVTAFNWLAKSVSSIVVSLNPPVFTRVNTFVPLSEQWLDLNAPTTELPVSRRCCSFNDITIAIQCFRI